MYNPSPGALNHVVSISDLRKEYVASSGWGWVTEYARTLPPYVDELTQQFGIDLYRRMRHDSQVSSAAMTVVMAVQAQGWHVAPPIASDDPQHDQAVEIADCITENFKRLEVPFSDVVYEVALGAITFGHKVAEQTYEVATWRGKPRLMLKSIKTKPIGSTAFVVDAYNNTLGLVYTRPGSPIPSLTLLNPVYTTATGTLPDPVIVPRRKFLIFSFQPENGDDRGTSLFRTAYHPWVVKRQVWKAYLQYLATFAQPSIVGYTSAKVDIPYLVDPNGVPLPAASPEQLMRDALSSIQNGAVGAFPNDAKVQVLEAHGDGRAFIEALNVANSEITKALILQTLTTNEGEHMARAASQVHQDVFGLFVRRFKEALADRIFRDVIAPLVSYNFGDDALPLAPTLTFGKTEHQDFASDATAVSNLVRSGYFHWSQYEELDDMLGLPARDPLAWKEQIAREEAVAWAGAVAAAQAPVTAAAQASAPGSPAPAGAATPPGGGGAKPTAGDDYSMLTRRLVAKEGAMRTASRLGPVEV